MKGMERKLVTVLFVDLVDSTEHLAGRDPEVVRRQVTRFFDEVAHCIVTHGGTVEKFAGDAVMAAFGIPLAHEDDAERAVRAGLATLAKVQELDLRARIGIESGEVVSEDGHDSTFATGEPVNLAARLQQEATPGEILIGPGTASLVRGRVELEPLEPRDIRGFGQPVVAHRVVCAIELGRPLRSLAAPLVGRDSELELLENTFARTVRDKRATLLTIYGDPGVGKSRLAREFVAGLDRANVLAGRCLPYGEGVTYWPLAEMVKSSAGITDDDPLDEAQRKIREYCEDDAVADLLGLAVGVLEAVEGERSQQEISWAARAWAEQLAAAQPLVLVFEDVHWGEEPLLELIEHLAAWVREQPLLLLCIARPELLDIRPAWGGGRVRSTSLELEPLQPDESAELVAALTAELELPVDIKAVLAKSEGNPLFVEETIRMLAERPRDGAERIPDTLQALIAARIDRLPGAERALLQRAAAMGRIFMAGALAQLSPELDVSDALDGLLLRDLIVREPRATISGEQAFKFRHVLIREVAYAGLSKMSRAELHRAFAGWLKERAGDELVEIRAFHLDQAARLLAELDGSAPHDLSEEAAEALTHAGRRALSREAFRSARKLLLRASELAPTLERRYFAGRAAWRLGDMTAVIVEMEDVAAVAASHGERQLQGRALTALAEAVLNQRADAIAARELAEQAIAVLADEPPDIRFEAFRAATTVAAWLSDGESFERWAKLALEAARAAHRKDQEVAITIGLAQTYILRLELDEAEPLVERVAELAEESGSVVGRADALLARGTLENWRGNEAVAEAAFTGARELYREVGNTAAEAGMSMQVARCAMVLGDYERAEKLLADAVRTMKGLNDRARLCEAQRSLAEVYLHGGRLEEAERLALEARESVGPEDRVSISTTKISLAAVRAAQGRDDEADHLLREGVDELERLQMRAIERWALRRLVEFYRDRARDDDAVAYEARLAELSPSSTAPIA
jgi:class 3 adenylate cyclase/tetratricopeptide (TPR) repeat protein